MEELKINSEAQAAFQKMVEAGASVQITEDGELGISIPSTGSVASDQFPTRYQGCKLLQGPHSVNRKYRRTFLSMNVARRNNKKWSTYGFRGE